MVRDIEPSEWTTFLESFTMQHDHWLVRVDDEKETLPLEGLLARDGVITVHLGSDLRHHRVITIDAARVTVLQTGGADEGLAIEARNGAITRLRFRSAVAPELVDGIL